MKKNDIRLYNVMFPIWFMYLLLTPFWLMLLPVNFAVDSLVIYCSARSQEIDGRLELWKKSILSVWLMGFLSDFLGAAVTFILFLVLDAIPDMIPLLTFPGTTLISIPGVILAGLLIYWLNRIVSFRESGLEKSQIHKLCLHLALWTAPYTMLIPFFL